MSFEFGKFSADIQAKIYKAISNDGKISAEELRNMQLDKKDSVSIMETLLNDRELIGDGFEIVTDKENGISLISGSSFNTEDVILNEKSLDTYRKHFGNNNIAQAKYKDGLLYFYDSKGNIINDSAGKPLTASFNVTRYADGTVQTSGTNDSKTIPYMGEIVTPDMKFSKNGEYILPENPADTPYAIANNILIAKYNQAYRDLIENYKNSGWSSEVAEAVKITFGSEATFESVKAELDKMRAQIAGLKIALHTGEAAYLEQFEKIFNVPFDKKNIAELVTAESKYNLVQNSLEMQKAFDSEFNFILNHEKPIERHSISDNETGKTYENTINKEIIFQREFKKLAQFMDKISKGLTKDENMTGEELLNQLFEYNQAETTEEKYSIMYDFVKNYSTMLGKTVQISSGGKSLEELNEISKNKYKTAFGDSGDIQKMVSDYIITREKNAGTVKMASTLALTLFVSALTAGSGSGAAIALLKGGAIFAGANTAIEISDSASKLKNLDAKSLIEYIKNVGEDVNWGEVMQANLIGGAMSVIFAGQSYLITNLTRIGGEAIGAGAKTIATTAGVLDTAGVMATGTAMEYMMSGKVTIEGTAFNIVFTIINGMAHVKQIKEIGSNNTAHAENNTKPLSSNENTSVNIKPATQNIEDGFVIEIGNEKYTAKTMEEVQKIINDKAPNANLNFDVTLEPFMETHAEDSSGFFSRIKNKFKRGKKDYNTTEGSTNHLDKYVRNKNQRIMEHSDFVRSRKDLFGSNMHDFGFWRQYTPKDQHHGAWKMHLFSIDDADWQVMCDVIIPYLKNHDIEWKTLNIAHTPEMLDGVQSGKAFTIYPKNNEDMAQIAKDLDYIIRKNKLEKSGSHITGDNQMGSTGRLFYRYEFNSGAYKDEILDLDNSSDYMKYNNRYDPNRGEGKYLADDMTLEDDIWRDFDPSDPNAKPSAPSSSASSPSAQTVNKTRLQKGQSLEIQGSAKLNLANTVEIDLNDIRIKSQIDNLPEGGRLTIGRTGDIQINDPTSYVSRIHVIIEKHNGKIYVIDNSTNGTTVTQTKISEPAAPRNDNQRQANNINPAKVEAYAKFDANATPHKLPRRNKLEQNLQYEIETNKLPALILVDGTEVNLNIYRTRIENIQEGDFLTIGRDGDIKINASNYVSRHHILITRYNGKIIMKDISYNGNTYCL